MAQISPGSPAERAGLQTGDVIVSLAGRTVQNTDGLFSILADLHVGQTVTIHAAVEEVKTGRGGATFLDMGGAFPDNAFAAVIFASDLAKFPSAKTLKGKTVAISGPVQLYQGKPGDASAPCALFGGKQVSGKGWCSAYVKKA